MAAKAAPNIDVMEEVRGKCLVKERDNKNYKENTLAEQDSTQKAITGTRTSNFRKRLEIMESFRTDTYMIQDILGSRPECMVGMLSATAGSAVENLHQRVCMARRRYDDLHYLRKKRFAYLDEMDLQIARLSSYEGKFNASVQAERFRYLQNELDKAKIRYDTAYTVTEKYEKLRDLMREDIRWYPNRMAAITELIEVANTELNKMSELNALASADSLRSTKELTEQEEICYEVRRIRDQEVNEAKGKFQPCDGIDFSKRGPKAAPDFLLKEKELKAQAEKKARNETLLALLKEFLGLQHVLGEADPSGGIRELSRIHDVKARLADRLQRRTERRDKLAEEQDVLTEKFVVHEYQTNASETEQLLELTDEITVTLQKAREMREEMSAICNSREILISEIQTGLTAFFVKLRGIKLKPPLNNLAIGDTLEDFRTIERKLLLLFEQVKDSEEFLVERHRLLEDRRLFEFMRNQVPLDALRVRGELTGESVDYSVTADVDCENYHTREDIKQLGEKLVFIMTRPKRRKKPQRRLLHRK